MEIDPQFLTATQAHQYFMRMHQEKGQHSPDHMHKVMLEAEHQYNQALNANPDDRDTIMQLATLFLQTGRNALCVKLLEPLNDWKDLAILNNLGAACRNEHRNEEAKKYFEAALKLQRHPDLLANMAALAVNEGCPEQGIQYGRECLAAQPNHSQGDWNMGLLLLENKEYEEGFKRYARGFETGERIIRHYKNKDGKPSKFWKGEDLNGKSIVVHGEQGIGDELLFLQFVPSLIEKYPDMHLVLDVHPRLKPMIERSLNVSDIFPTRKTEPKWNEHIPVDYKDGLGSLPAYFWQDMGKHVPWLEPDIELGDLYSGATDRVVD